MAGLATGFVEDPPPAASAGFVEDAPAAAAPADDRGFLTRAWDDIASVPGRVKANVVEAGQSIGSTAKKAFTHPIERLKEIPGEVAGVVKGAGHVANNAVDAASLGYFKAGRDFLGSKIAPEATATNQAEEERFRAENPFLAGTGDAIGTVTGPVNKLATTVAAKAVSPLAKAFEKAIGGKLVSAASKVPLAGPALATAAEGLGGAAMGIADYEAAAPAISAASAGAEGHRLETAEHAASDPAGIILSGAAGGIPAASRRGAAETEKYIEHAKKSADEWLIKDVVGEDRGATPTARKQLARDAEDVKAIIKSDSDLRDAVGKARHGDKTALEEARTVVRSKLDAAGAPRERLYSEVDAALPSGGIRAGDVVDDLDAAIKARTKTGKGYDAAEARELTKIRERIRGAEEWGGGDAVDPKSLSDKAKEDIATLRSVRKNLETRAPQAIPQIDSQIAEIEGTGTRKPKFDADTIVPSVKLRDLVSDAQRTAFESEGGLNGTERYTRAKAVAGAVKDILDSHIESARDRIPDTVKAIEKHNTDVSALLNIGKVLDQRLGKATQEATGASTPAHVSHGIKSMAAKAGALPSAAVLAATGHYVPAAAVLGAAAAPALKRLVDTKVARFASTPQGQKVIARLIHASATGGNLPGAIQGAIAAGVSPRVARRIVEISRQTFAGQGQDATADATTGATP